MAPPRARRRNVNRFLDGGDKIDFLFHVGDRRFAGRAVDYQTICTIRDQLLGEFLSRLIINGTVGFHRRNHSGQNAPKRRRIKKMHGGVTHTK